MIEIQHISKQFGDRVIIDDISAHFKPGICNLIIGTSGSGKTVLVKCIVDLLKSDKGEVLFDNIPVSTMGKEDRKELRQNLGMLFQGNALFDSMTVEENVRFPLDMFSELSVEEKKIKVNEILARVQLGGVNSKFPAELSGGHW
jgi:phospholipid/cholesterol/gamma-HCH transport system ATP-binding protein